MKTIQRIAVSMMMFILTNCATTNYSEQADMLLMEQNKSEADDTIANSGQLISDDFPTKPICYNRNNSECATCEITMDETNEE